MKPCKKNRVAFRGYAIILFYIKILTLLFRPDLHHRESVPGRVDSQ